MCDFYIRRLFRFDWTEEGEKDKNKPKKFEPYFFTLLYFSNTNNWKMLKYWNSIRKIFNRGDFVRGLVISFFHFWFFSVYCKELLPSLFISNNHSLEIKFGLFIRFIFNLAHIYCFILKWIHFSFVLSIILQINLGETLFFSISSNKNLLTKLFNERTRSFSSGPVGLSPEETKKYWEQVSKRWNWLGIGGFAITLITAVYNLFVMEHEHRGDIQYPYMRIRNKPFPWGDRNLIGKNLKWTKWLALWRFCTIQVQHGTSKIKNKNYVQCLFFYFQRYF